MNTYGVISNGAHIDVSKTEQGAKRYATIHGFNIVTIRYNCGYAAQQIAYKYGNKWKQFKHD